VEQVEIIRYNLFALIAIPENAALQHFLLGFTALLISAVSAIALLLVLQAVRRFVKIQTALTYWGFGAASLCALAFALFTLNVNDPGGMTLTAFPFILFVIAASAMVAANDALRRNMQKDWQLWVLLLPAVALVFIFSYLPMYGIQIAFRDFKAAFGITGSEWVGLMHFRDFFGSFYSTRLILNTLLLNVYGLLWSFPVPIVMAILLNQIPRHRFKRFTQTAIYAPHFISPVVMVGMLFLFFSPSTGFVNKIIELTGGSAHFFMMDAGWFRTLFIGSGIWQSAGWNTILYIAALTAIDPGLYEAATIDGATKTQKIRYLDIPHLVPIIILLLILNCGAMLVSNTDKALLMQTAGNMSRSDIIGVYVYTKGLAGSLGQFSHVAAVNLLVNVINFILIVSVNWIARRMSDTSLF
jgi:putative aldouronate transport system permease protein